MIEVTYSDGDVEQYKDIQEAQASILEAFSSHDVTVENVEEIDSDGNTVKELTCEWSVKLV